MATENRPEDYLKDFQDGLGKFGQKMKGMMDDLFSSEGFSGGGFRIPADAYIDETHFYISFELPGVTKKEVKIQVIEDSLHIKGEKVRKEKSDTYLIEERRFGEFHRAIELPSFVELKDIKATYEDGILTVRFPLEEGANTEQEVDIE